MCSSATIGNPGELAATLTGRRFQVIDRSGAPRGERHVLILDPPPLDARSGVRPGPSRTLKSARAAAMRSICATSPRCEAACRPW